jgi:hypothetical protein
MNKHWLRLFDWFDRPRARGAHGVPPIAVTPARAREARRYLQEHSGFDFEKFRRSVHVDQLMQEPLGETAECLSAEELATVVQSRMVESPAMLDRGLIARGVWHIASCDACFQNIAVYQEIERQGLKRAVESNIEELSPSFWIDPIGRVEVIGDAAPILALGLTMHRDQASRFSSGAMKVRVSCPFETRDIELHLVPEQDKRWFILSRSRRASGQKVSKDFIHGYYCTEPLVDLGQLKDHVCSFVSVSQQVGGAELHSTQMIRLQRGQGADGG